MTRTNQDWLDGLNAHDPALLQELHDVLRRGLLAAFNAKVDAEKMDAFAEDIAQQSVLKVLDHLETFQGRSKFLTWATKIAIRTGLSELRHARWRERSLNALLENNPSFSMPVDDSTTPEQQLEQQEAIQMLNLVIAEDLTAHQRTALLSILIHQAPIEVVASQMGISRNAVYKAIHDARKRLKYSLAKRGYSIDGILEPFQ